MNPTPIDPSNTFDWLREKFGQSPVQATAIDLAFIAAGTLVVYTFWPPLSIPALSAVLVSGLLIALSVFSLGKRVVT